MKCKNKKVEAKVCVSLFKKRYKSIYINHTHFSDLIHWESSVELRKPF